MISRIQPQRLNPTFSNFSQIFMQQPEGSDRNCDQERAFEELEDGNQSQKVVVACFHWQLRGRDSTGSKAGSSKPGLYVHTRSSWYWNDYNEIRLVSFTPRQKQPC